MAENAAVPLKEHTALGGQLIREIALVKIGLTGLPSESAVKYPSELSSGMRRRAGLARAIALDPELLFLDEPTAGLDPISAGGLDELIERLKARLGLTIVMVTHDLDALWRLADRVAVLGEGEDRRRRNDGGACPLEGAFGPRFFPSARRPDDEEIILKPGPGVRGQGSARRSSNRSSTRPLASGPRHRF
ncbi:MAG: ATP-binding cassette domain-containing protein [Candidatus Manganitrophus sp.]|nr:ATP-binding cassette domain-containing protein [Candidatus Manganitrophus sp.]WDT71864.1 MAG: ATP-binding cassette domain-containing protein [Candidatus Manganitrophus sp.]